jgi:hypothetical protein
LDENSIENTNEIHFIINCDNGKTFGFKGDEHIKYIDLVSGEIGMIMGCEGHRRTRCNNHCTFHDISKSKVQISNS